MEAWACKPFPWEYGSLEYAVTGGHARCFSFASVLPSSALCPAPCGAGLHLLHRQPPSTWGPPVGGSSGGRWRGGACASAVYSPGSLSAERLPVGCVHLANVAALLAVLAAPLSSSPGRNRSWSLPSRQGEVTAPADVMPQGNSPFLFFL